jgi:hypothetical protein
MGAVRWGGKMEEMDFMDLLDDMDGMVVSLVISN